MYPTKVQDSTATVCHNQKQLAKILPLLDRGSTNKKEKVVCRWLLDERSKLYCQWFIE